jgi:hypothetical protein
MESTEKLRRLENLLDRANNANFSYQDTNFLNWKNEVERNLEKIYGRESTEFFHFSKLRFCYTVARMSGGDYSSSHRQCFDKDYSLLKKSLIEYIDEIKNYEVSRENIFNKNVDTMNKKIFISHATKDKTLIEEIIELIESIGVESEKIFCSSFEGYGIPLGENFLERIKQELSSEVLVLFVLTQNFYESKICLCEMGAAWALSKNHVPIVVPPLNYIDIQAVIPLTQGLLINDSSKLNSFKDKLENDFRIESKLTFSAWERKRDRFIRDINTHLSDVEPIFDKL